MKLLISNYKTPSDKGRTPKPKTSPGSKGRCHSVNEGFSPENDPGRKTKPQPKK